MIDLCKYGYAYSPWKCNEKRSETQITPLGESYLKVLEEIRLAPLDLESFKLKEKYSQFVAKAKLSSKLYLPHSMTYRLWMKKKPALISYLQSGPKNAEQIYQNTPIKDKDLLNLAVREGLVKRTKLHVTGWFSNVRYELLD